MHESLLLKISELDVEIKDACSNPVYFEPNFDVSQVDAFIMNLQNVYLSSDTYIYPKQVQVEDTSPSGREGEFRHQVRSKVRIACCDFLNSNTADTSNI